MSYSSPDPPNEASEYVKISTEDLAKLNVMANSYGAIQAKLEFLEASSHFRPQSGTSNREPRISDPEHFDGKRSKVRNFLSQVRLVIHAQPSRFVTDRQKVMFAASFLRSTAFSWFEPFLDSPTDSVILEDFSVFAHTLQTTFGDPDQTGSAERELFSLRQIASVAAYSADFRRISTNTSWNDAALNAQFYRGLKDPVKDELAKIEKPETLDSLIEIAVRLDNRLHERRMERDNLAPSRSSKPNFQRSSTATHNSSFLPTPPISYPSTYTGVRPMEIDGNRPRFKTLTFEEKERRRKNNLCLYCGKPGHIANICPVRSTFSSDQGSRPIGKLNASRISKASDIKMETHRHMNKGNDQVQ
jgi:Ty3 transposon capsid-like protein